MKKQEETSMTRQIRSLIRYRGGPITLAEYMSEVLTNPQHGYYTQRDVFGASGDFVTSPEVSQLFGEMLGIWAVAMWEQLGNPSRLRIVEFGPGRGTLMSDLLRGVAPFRSFVAALEVSLVEVSPVLRRLQWQALGCVGEWTEATTEGVTDRQVKVSWHRSLDEISTGCSAPPTLYLAHEFFDALPVHQFHKGERTWCEILVAESEAKNDPFHFRMVLSPGPTPATKAILPARLEGIPSGLRDEVQALEVCAQGMALVESLAKRVASDDGAALIIDYGRDGPYSDSLAAIRKHRFVNVFDLPGTADLSARVDFSALRLAVARSGAETVMHGPIAQAELLGRLGIGVRVQKLLEKANPDEAKALIAGYRRLVEGRRREQQAAASNPDGGTEGKESVEGVVNDPEIEGMGESYVAACIGRKGSAIPIPFDASTG